MTDPTYYIPCLYTLTNRNLNRTYLKMNEGGIYIVATVYDNIVSGNRLYIICFEIKIMRVFVGINRI